MTFYFFSYALLGGLAANNSWWVRRGSQFPSSVPIWMLNTKNLIVITAICNVISLLALGTSWVNFGFVWFLASVGEAFLGAFLIGLLPHTLRILLVIISLPVCILLIGAFWGFWYI